MITADQFRRTALEIPGAIESAHLNHPDFRIGGKIFASLGYPDENGGMVALTPARQRALMHQAPRVFSPCNGAWGRQGATAVNLNAATADVARAALAAAAKTVAAKQQVPHASKH